MSEPEVPPEEVSEEAGSGALRSFLGLFIVPLLVVILCVAVFIGFGWIAYDRQTTGDYVNDLQSWWKPRRVQAAYELSKILVSDPRALDEESGAKQEVRRLFLETREPEMRQYLALVLGRTRDREAVPLLLAALQDPDDKTRIYALWALGTLGDPRGRAALETALEDQDPGLRKIAAFALGEMGDRAAVPRLTAALDDAAADVRWNAALALARLGSDAGLPVLETMVDRRLLTQVPDITREQQEEAMVSAIRALAVVGGVRYRPTFEALAKDDPSLKVRQAAIEARQAVDARGRS
ncbi:MAG TPA: HEAT repeat domain-containing protein [Thermoanaerobaculia bacterium]|jgi:HEAT repeat protein|nr:HEAT repeat domain-containing protein [Thermoanaerobaculia bacterium]